MAQQQKQTSPISDEQICCCLVCCIFLQQCCSELVDRHFRIFNILFFQFTSMIFVTYCVIIKGGLLSYPGTFLSIVGIFVASMWTGRFTGGFLNPALTVACMIKKQRKVPLLMALVYFFVHFSGALIGTFIAWATYSDLSAPFQAYFPINSVAEVFGREVIGSFFYCMVMMIMMSSDTTFLEMEIQIWFSNPLLLVTICEMARLPFGCNPAWSLAYQLVWGINNQQFYQMSYMWASIAGPIIGAVFAGIFFQFVFRRFVSAYKSDLKREEEKFLERLNAAERIQHQFKHRMTILELV